MTIEAMVISAGQPQLDRCLASVQNQTVPFDSVVHIENVVPNSKAFNRGISESTSDWIFHIGGDFVLFPNAVEIATKYVNQENNDILCGYFFGLKDTFLQCDLGWAGVYRRSAWKDEPLRDTKWDDRGIPNRLRSKGWRFKKLLHKGLFLATHFDNPTAFQVFGRFYFHGCKFHDNSSVRNMMTDLFMRTGLPLYAIGLKAIDFAKTHNTYPGSPNMDYNKKMYGEFKEEMCKFPSLLPSLTATK